jgi:hypothetical protein
LLQLEHGVRLRRRIASIATRFFIFAASLEDGSVDGVGGAGDRQVAVRLALLEQAPLHLPRLFFPLSSSFELIFFKRLIQVAGRVQLFSLASRGGQGGVLVGLLWLDRAVGNEQLILVNLDACLHFLSFFFFFLDVKNVLRSGNIKTAGT